MTASSRGSKAAASLMRSSRHPRVCSDCITRISRPSQRGYASAAAASSPSSPSTTSPDASSPATTVPPVTAHAAPAASDYEVHSGLVLSRPPLLTQPPTPFEESFYFYQKRLNERLTLPFTRYFYFQKDTPAFIDWKLKAKERGWQPARELGGYNPHAEDAWNDELLIGSDLSSTSGMIDKLVTESVVRAVEGKDGQVRELGAEEQEKEAAGSEAGSGEAGEEGAAAVVKPLPRFTDADKSNDLTRLDRKLHRTLYLCVKRANGGWGFPSGAIEGRENLHEAAQRILTKTAGINMHTWIVGNAPAGHHVLQPFHARTPSGERSDKLERPGVRTFFMRARIMAGQANLKDNPFGLTEFRWLTKQEVQKHVLPRYFSAVKNMLHDR